MTVRLPNDTQRSVVIGRTGSGKTVAGIWQLSQRSWGTDTSKHHRKPWTIFDFKDDRLIAELPARELGVKEKPPKHPGLYVVRPEPETDDDAVTLYLRRMWENEKHGLYVDEGYMIGPRNKSLNLILTQGRSRQVPVIMLSQRPLWLTRFVWSEADFYQLFNLNDDDDRKQVTRFAPISRDYRFAPYHSAWYDVGQDELTLFSPVPSEADILTRFEDRAGKKLRTI